MTTTEKKPRKKPTPPTQTPGVPYSTNRYDMGECVPFIRNYKHARKHFEFVANTQKPFRNTSLYPVGKRSLRNRAMSESADGSISFYYEGEHFCTYHPDGAVTVQAYPQQRSGGLDRKVMPDGVWQDQFSRTGPCVILGHDTGASEVRWFWSEARASMDDGPPLNVVSARRPVTIRRVGGKLNPTWLPVNLDEVEPFEWECLDRSKALKVSNKAGLPDLVAVIKACNAMEAEIPEFIGQHGWRGGGIPDDYEKALALVEAGQFMEAVAYLRRADGQRRWDASQGTWTMMGDGEIVSTEFERLRTMLYLREGVLIKNSEKIVSWKQHQTIETNLRRFG